VKEADVRHSVGQSSACSGRPNLVWCSSISLEGLVCSSCSAEPIRVAVCLGRTILPDVDGWKAASSCSRTLLRTRFFVGGGVGVFDLGAVFFFCVRTGLDPFIVASADFLL
jgi:hypothetical protein